MLRPAGAAQSRESRDMAESSGAAAAGGAASSTVTTESEAQPEPRSLTLKLRKRKPDKKVEWSCDTVDNENLGRRSSKCCCIYEKPRAFGESSTESEDDDDEGCDSAHCIRGHKKRHSGSRGVQPPNHDGSGAMQH
ncbi:E3 ubiquitin-protein ligase PPP1R11 [Hyperolius riggenbachi]|uniref:E3 ubiquitin-protein ligase PPP1R11 n=1 Tax=Hyperolius riggenbachi TaxID=752182 RepID=UPI0035A39CE2